MVPVDPALSAAVAAAVGEPAARPLEVRREPLEYDAFLAHRSVTRLRGTAVVRGAVREWTLVEKSTEGPATASAYLVDNARREAAFYASGLSEQLAPAVRAPRLLGATTASDGRTTLFLEDVVHEGPRPFDAATVLAAARDLGGLAGRWSQRVPEEPWLFAGWVERHSQPGAVAAGLAVLDRADSVALARWGDRLAEARRLVLAQSRLGRVLDRLPRTLCHHDAVGANVFSTATGTVLIDWESVGPGPVGADLASLLFASARRGDLSAAVLGEVRDGALDAYVDGLRNETRTIDPVLVARGLDAAVALRWKLAVDVADAVGRGADLRRGSAPSEPPGESAAELSALVVVLLDAARRALDG